MDISWLVWGVIFTVMLAIALALAATLTTARSRRWAWSAAATTPFMFYALPLPGFYVSLNLLSGLAAFKGIATRPLWSFWWFRFAVLMTLCPVVSMAWSPTPMAGFRDFIYALPFFFLMGAVYQFDEDAGRSARKLLAIALVLCNVEALLVVVFRLSPTLEASFIGSRLAGIFISPNVLNGLFSGARNNIFDPVKAGGFFVNANVASAFLGCAAMLAWPLGAAERWRSMTVTAVICWVAVFFTGSKAGAVCAVLIPTSLVIVDVVRRREIGFGIAIFFCVALAAVVVATPTVWDLYQGSGFTRASTETLSVRQKIWGFAWRMFKAHPLAGLGNGGWEEKYPMFAISEGLDPAYPPHNLFLIMWSKSGLSGALAGLAYTVTFFVWCVRHALRDSAVSTSFFAGLTAAFVWVFLQASGENFGIIGEAHLTPLLAIAIGIAARESQRR